MPGPRRLLPPAAPPDPEADSSQTSTEQGQTHLDESFETEDDRRDRIREQRRKAFEDTKFDVQGRTYLLDRDKYDDTESYAWAIGGSAGLKTGYFRDRFAIGLTGYTSQPLDAPDDKDGTLAAGARPGGIYGPRRGLRPGASRRRHQHQRRPQGLRHALPQPQRLAHDAEHLRGDRPAGCRRQEGDGRVALRARLFRRDQGAQFRGFRIDVEGCRGPTVKRGVYSAGANYKKDALSIGAIDYYSDDIINILYRRRRTSSRSRKSVSSGSLHSTATRRPSATTCCRAPTSRPTSSASRPNLPWVRCC